MSGPLEKCGPVFEALSSLSALADDVIVKTEAYEQALAVEQEATRTRSRASNELSAAQKALDLAIAKAKTASPNGSSWGSR